MRQAGEPLTALSSGDCADLIKRIGAVDQAALTMLYEQFAGRMFALARRVVRSNECAQEIVCDVFIFVWQNSRRYDPERATVAAWLMVMTRNRAIDRWRENAKHPTAAEPHTGNPGGVQWEDPAFLLDQFEDNSNVRAALATLSPLRQRLVSMAFFEGLSHEEIAAAVSMPLGTVKSHVRRALSAMRPRVDRLGRDEAFAVASHDVEFIA